MKRTVLTAILSASALIAASPARAQVGVYGQFAATHDSSLGDFYRGYTLGGYDNMVGLGPIKAGFDIRGSYGTENQYSYRSFLFGPRVAIRPPVLPISPFIQAAVGFGGTRYSTTAYSNKLQYGVIGGLDYTVFPHIDLRVPEIDYLHMSPAANTSDNLVGIGFGLVIRL